MPHYAIIGAGQTGRGFIARLLQHEGDRLTFIDKNESLVNSLNDSESYTIYFKAQYPLW